MDNLSSLEQKVDVLSKNMVDLKCIQHRMAEREGGDMDGWLQKVKGRERELNEIRKEFDNLRETYDDVDSLKATETLSQKVIGNQKEVKFLRDAILLKAIESMLNSKKLKPKQFSHEDLKNYTSDSRKCVAVGAFSKVYKGKIDDMEVAIKVLEDDVAESFTVEMETMVMASQQNLVTLYGYCFESSMKALVYEYMKNGSLDKILFENHLNLEWGKLYTIAIGIAKGLAYLHNDCDKQIIHRDMKPANVLIDESHSPKITDFGVAKLLSIEANHYTLTSNQGTHGYIAPEFKDPTSEITNKCDVYSFGVMLYEVLAERCNGKFGQKWFPTKIWKKFEKGKLDKLIESLGIPEIHKGKAKILSMVAFWCSQYTVEMRPSMSNVVEILEKEIPVNTPPYPFKYYLPPLPSHEIHSESLAPDVFTKAFEEEEKKDVAERNSDEEALSNMSEQVSSEESKASELRRQMSLKELLSELCTRMNYLKRFSDLVARSQPEIEWLQKVKGREVKVTKLRSELDELNGGKGLKSRYAKHYLNKKVLENLRVVEILEKEYFFASLEKLAKRYSNGDIKEFISTFSNSKLSGDDGDIYTGLFKGKQVAVKVLPEETVVDEIFFSEVSTIARASHRHIVKLYGFCFEGNMRALVYEYMENGSFDKILYKNHLNLAWEKLYSIAIETAKGIAYLHHGCGEQIIHHDIRAHNVLLDNDLSPRVTGIGMAKLRVRVYMNDCIIWTRIRGTASYSAPETWLPSSRITTKSDVYSFGVMLFEILGKRTIGIGRNHFSKQVWEKFNAGQLDQIIRDCGIVEKDRRKATVLTTLALWCIQTTPVNL